MATHDYVIANQSGAAFRTDLNNALAAIVSNNSNSSSPSTTYPYQWWADTNAGVLKIRNSLNNAWIELLQLDGTLTMETSTTASAPSLSFRGDLDTGVFQDSTNHFQIATAGVERVEFQTTEVVFNDGGADCDFRIEGDTDANLFKVDAENDRIGIKTAAPQAHLHISGTEVRISQTGSNSDAFLTFFGQTTNNGAILRSHQSDGNAGHFFFQGSTTTYATMTNTALFLVGNSSARTNFFNAASTHRPLVQFEGANNNFRRGMVVTYGHAGNIGPYLILAKHRSNTIGQQTAAVSGDELGIVDFQGSDGTNFVSGARVDASINNTVSSGTMPARLNFRAADSGGTLNRRGSVHGDAGVTGVEHHQFIFPITGSTDEGSTISNPVERFTAPAFNCADTGDFVNFAYSSHWRHRAYANVSIWFGESGSASGNTYDASVQVFSASSNQGYTNTNHTFSIDIGTFSNGRMKNQDFTASWPTHGASRFVQGRITFTKNSAGSGTSLQYMGMRVVEYTSPA